VSLYNEIYLIIWQSRPYSGPSLLCRDERTVMQKNWTLKIESDIW